MKNLLIMKIEAHIYTDLECLNNNIIVDTLRYSIDSIIKVSFSLLVIPSLSKNIYTQIYIFWFPLIINRLKVFDNKVVEQTFKKSLVFEK